MMNYVRSCPNYVIYYFHYSSENKKNLINVLYNTECYKIFYTKQNKSDYFHFPGYEMQNRRELETFTIWNAGKEEFLTKF